ncbi:SdpI family protein [Sandaracinus amylolyticus]|uniref:DUF1648 domain-containing protein n=1 Tax=Sandaracinus amylolyticus TaxID=927083 RepID=A0A0F6SDB4_9BACT|nr:SdpI family protein [Sandaracinus amylolyticus]AKF03149.1 Hypothetical protein DB32_000298 [Sandaracinus amylolyticus]
MSSMRSSWILGTVALVGSAVVYPWLPPEVPIHFDVTGHVDGTAPKAIGAFLLPVITLLTIAIVTWVHRRRPEHERAPIVATTLLSTALLTGLQTIILRAALLGVTDVAVALGTLLALASLGLALLLPRVRRNPVVGIRTPWTLASDEVWARSHRLGGYFFAAAGVIGLSAVLLGCPAVAVVALVAAAVAAGVGSWWIAREA